MKRKQERMIILALAMSFSVSAQDSVAHRFSLQQAVEYASKHNQQVKNALLDLKIQQETNKEVTSAAYPQINGNFSFTDNLKLPVSLVPGDFFGQPGTYVPLKFGVKYNAIGGIELNQILFDGQVFVGLQARKTALDFFEKNVGVTEELIKANIYKIYYQLVLSKTQIDLLESNIARLEKLLHDTREIYKNGFAEKLDIDRVSVQLANLQSEKVKAQNQVDNGYMGLKLLMGMPIKDSLVLTDNITYEQVREDLPVLETFKYTDRKEYQYAELGVKLNQYNIKRYKLSKIPTVSLNGYYNKNAQRNDTKFFSGDWFSISAITLKVNIPIFHGFATRARIDRANFELQKSINQQEQLKLSIDHDIGEARNNFQAAIARLEFARKNMQLAEDVYNQTKKKYEAGTGSNLEINAAQVDLNNAQSIYISALYDAVNSRVNYLKATGRL